MKKKWTAPVVETLDVSLTAKGWHPDWPGWPPDGDGDDEEGIGDS